MKIRALLLFLLLVNVCSLFGQPEGFGYLHLIFKFYENGKPITAKELKQKYSNAYTLHWEESDTAHIMHLKILKEASSPDFGFAQTLSPLLPQMHIYAGFVKDSIYIDSLFFQPGLYFAMPIKDAQSFSWNSGSFQRCELVKRTKEENKNDDRQDTIPRNSKSREKWKSTKHFNNRYGLNFSYSYQVHSMIEAGISKYLMATTGTTNDEFESRTHVENNLSAGTSLEFVLGKHFILGTKLFANLGYKWFSAQLNVTAFTDFNTITPVITPELGIGNWIGIRYGYNIKLGQNPFDEIGTHRIVIFIKLYYAGFRHTFSSYT